MDTIDDTDLKILKLLSADSRIRIKDLSKTVMMSEPSVKRRIEKMVDIGFCGILQLKLIIVN